MNGTPPFLAKRVRAALAEAPALLPFLYAFHAGAGWGNSRNTIVPILTRVRAECRPPMVWLLGPLPLSASARCSVNEWFAYLFGLGYSVRWTSACSFCDAGVNEEGAPHRCVFSILALLDDAQAHCPENVTMTEAPDFKEYNAACSIPKGERTCLNSEGVSLASVMHKNVISVLLLRVLFSRLLLSGGQQGRGCHVLFFEEERFLNVDDNDLSVLLVGDGYGCRGEFGVVQRRRLCRKNESLTECVLSVQYVNWVTSFCE